MQLNFLLDENIEHYDYFFADFAHLQSKAGRKMTAADVQQKQALLVRSVTQVNAALLAGSDVQFVGSATIGTDHLDIDYLNQQGIVWSNAAGCNAQAVAEYIITALYAVQPDIFERQTFCLGIVGLGNVGTRLARSAHALGWQVKGYDPLVQHSHIEQVAWQDVLQCDAISIHTPLTKTGEYPTYHLFDELAFEQMNPQAILMNAARGEVVKQSALLQDIALRQRTVILDVFEFEPNIQYDVLDYVKVVTPHIAGYSLEGKIRGTAMLYERVCQHFQRQANKSMYDLLQPCETRFTARPDAETLKQQLKQHLPHIYQIMQDDQQLRQCLQHGMVHGDDFDALRKHYHLRREWSAYGLELFQ